MYFGHAPYYQAEKILENCFYGNQNNRISQKGT